MQEYRKGMIHYHLWSYKFFTPLYRGCHISINIFQSCTERKTNFMARTLSLLEKLSHRIAKFTRMNTSVGEANSDREELVPSIKCTAPQWICYVPETLQHQANVRCNTFPARLKFEPYTYIFIPRSWQYLNPIIHFWLHFWLHIVRYVNSRFS